MKALALVSPLQNRQGATYLRATYDPSVAGLGILETGHPVLALGICRDMLC
jgi:hypothetical protein